MSSYSFLGTSPAGLAAQVLTILTTEVQGGWSKPSAWRQNWQGGLKRAIYTLLSVWIVTLVVCLVTTIYSDHQNLTAQLRAVVREKDELKNDLKTRGEYIQQLKDDATKSHSSPKSLPVPTVINAQGGIPIVGNTGTVDHPTVNNFAPPQRTLTPEQRAGIVNLLRQPGSFSVVIRHAGNNFEAQTYAESLASALRDAGWKVNDNPGLMFETKQGVGLKILVRDLQKPPVGAVLLQTSLKQIGLDADGSAQEVVPEGETWLYVGVHP